MDIKNIIIFLIVFLVIMWLQHNDDKKFGKNDKRISLYDKIKIPLISAILVVLIKELDLNECTNFIHSIMVVKVPAPPNIETCKNVLDDIYINSPDF